MHLLYGHRQLRLLRRLSNISPEATTFSAVSPSTYSQTKWTSYASDRLLLEAGASRNTMNWNDAPQPGVGPDVISVTELRTNLTYRAPSPYTGREHDDAVHAETYYGTFAASYVTGSHAFKVGHDAVARTPVQRRASQPGHDLPVLRW